MRRRLLAVCVFAATALFSARGSETHALFLNAAQLPDSEAENAVRQQIQRFQNMLAEVARISPDRQTAPDDQPLTKERIQRELQNLSVRTPKDGRALVYLRAYAAKTGGGHLYLYPAGADPAAPVENQPSLIRDEELNAWLAAYFEGSETLLFLDLISTHPSIAVYYTNRVSMGSNSVHMIASRPLDSSLADLAAEVLKGPLDENDDRAIDMGEMANAVQLEGSVREWARNAAFSGTGDGASILFELPSAVVVIAAPGAAALIDGKEIGSVTARYEAEPGRTYQASAAKAGFRAVEPMSVSVSKPYGEAAVARFLLEPIRIDAQIRLPAGEQPAMLTTRLRPDAGLLRELNENERSRLTLNSADYSFELGTEYHLLVGTPDNTLFGAARFVFGGYDDIPLEIHLEKRTEWQVAQIYFEDGFQDHALKTAEKARDSAYEIPLMSVEFMTFLFSAWSTDETNARAMIGCALLSFYLGETNESRGYWKKAKDAAPKGSADYDEASKGLKSVGGGWTTYAVILGFLTLIASTTVWMVLRHRRSLKASP